MLCRTITRMIPTELRSRVRSSYHLRRLSGILTIALFAGSAAAQTNALRFGGAPVELTFGAVSERTLRIELSPIDGQGRAPWPAPNPELVPLTVTGEQHVRELAHEQEFRSGVFRVILR